ncbi:MAG: SDR family oxidoreductase [Acidobacteriota bacterium]
MPRSAPDAKVAVITAASQGMGAGVARRLHADGYRLALLSRSEKIHDLARELGAAAVQGSVDRPEDLDSLVDSALERYGRIDAAVCNTGHPPKGDLLELDDAAWHSGLDLVFLNVVRIARRVTPVMQRQGGGSLVAISTFGAVEPSLTFPVSSALRSALGAFVKLYADRFGGDGIRLNAVLPGFVETYDVNEETRARIPLGRPAAVDEIASTVAFLLSDGGGYITGQSLLVDGGLTRSI